VNDGATMTGGIEAAEPQAAAADAAPSTPIRFTFARELSHVARAGEVDALLVSTKNGLAPLGAARRFFAIDLGIPVRELSEIARWAHYANASLSLVALASRNPPGCLKGVVIAPAESAKCYRQFSAQGGPGHDFRYRVWREAIAYAAGAWGTRCLAIDNFSLAESGIAASHLAGVRRLGADSSLGSSCGELRVEERGAARVIHLAW
jgi:hypothetical protein